MFVESDGDDNSSRFTIEDVRERYQNLKQTHDLSLLYVSSGSNVRVQGRHIGLDASQIIELNEACRDVAYSAMERLQAEFLSSEPRT